MELVNGTQFLLALFAASLAAMFLTAIVSLASTYAHYNHINLTLALKF